MTEQDEDLAKLEETVTSTKHIALAVNEELDLHTRLLVCLCDLNESRDDILSLWHNIYGILHNHIMLMVLSFSNHLFMCYFYESRIRWTGMQTQQILD
jgi:hypothetical protein